MIDFVASILKACAGFVAEQEGSRPNGRALYATGDGSWSFLIPVSVRGTQIWYDKVSMLEVQELHPKTPSRDLEQLHQDQAPRLDIERRAPDRIRNHYHIFVFERVRGKFMRSRSRRLPGGDLHYLYFFSQALGVVGITMRLLYLFGKFFLKRAQGIRSSLKFEPYKALRDVVEFFETIGGQMFETGKKFMVRVRREATRLGSGIPDPDLVTAEDQQKVAAAILGLCQYLPEAGPAIRGLISIYYAQYIAPGGGSGPPGK